MSTVLSTKWLTTREVAKRYAVHPDKVLGWIASGQLHAMDTVSNPGQAKRPRWRISAEALEQFERSRMSTPPAPRTTRRRRADAGVTRYF